jgi:hypothetical protein
VYAQLRLGGVPCPPVEAFIEKDGADGGDGLFFDLVEAGTAAAALKRLGQSAVSCELCA